MNTAKIYIVKFYNNDNNIYIGSTIQSLGSRFSGHKRHLTCSLYKYIKDKYNKDWSNCYITLYQNFNYNTKQELLNKEGEIIKLFKSNNDYNVINKSIAGRSIKEYRNDNKDELKKKQKIYDEKRKYDPKRILQKRESNKRYRERLKLFSNY